MNEQIADEIAKLSGRRPAALSPLSGGCVGEVYKASFPGSGDLVVKVDRQKTGALFIEGKMLLDLKTKTSLPVPQVMHHDTALLIMEYVEGESSVSKKAEQHAARLLAGLHSLSAKKYGYRYDTVIGGLHQPNPESTSWVEFYKAERILYMANEGQKAGRLPAELFGRLCSLVENLDRFLIEPDRPSLIHGDVWSGNVLSRGSEITAFLDPAVYFAHFEVELAFIRWLSCFGETFFKAYSEINPVDKEFYQTRLYIYQLYPVLVHIRLFGGGYTASLDDILRRFGF